MFFCSQGALALSEKSFSRKSCARCHRSKSKMLLYCQFDVHQTMHTDFLSQFDLRCTIFAFGVPHNSIKPHNRIYVLVRGSSKGAAQGRVDNEIFGSRIWETLRAQFPDEAQF